MEKIIYVKLLEEGTTVYRPVSSIELKNNVYEIKGHDIYDSEDEVWEFEPGTRVVVEEQELDGELVLVAVSEESRKQ